MIVMKLMEWNIAGLVVGVIVLIPALLLWRNSRPSPGSAALRRVLRWVAGVAAAAGVLMTLGGVIHLCFALWYDAHAHPPGRIVDVGGYDMHIFCEGEVKDLPAVIWMTGGRTEGLFLNHLHKRLRSMTRSCLYDRTGTGWSGVSTETPNRLVYDANDLARLLRASGEYRHGPFLLVGHSAGGILAPNFAALHPELTAGVLLLDPSAPLHDFIGRDLWCDIGPSINAREAWLISFGLTQILPRRVFVSPADLEVYKDIADVLPQIRANRARNPVGPWLMATSASCRDPLGMVFTPGALGDLPLMVIVQPERTKAQYSKGLRYLYPMSDFELENHYRLSRMIEHQYELMSSRGIFRRAPAGTTHMFPYERPDFVAARTVEMLKITAASGGWSLRPAPLPTAR